ncbi:MAG: antibiotic biosynthesis monooxygenase [Mesorhizobium sp.]|nr:MAG: antibiotic biosynthesis monooxygenase [Mesorhizobium sp.]TKB97395.1 MAG: antibiotic biosynthesis monooxygenase [Mesorhizobium sp.]
MLIVTGYVHVEPSAVAEFVTDIEALAHSAKQRDGGLFYAVAVDGRAAGRLLVAERWRDQASLTAHLHAPETLTFVERWRDRMRADLRKYDAANERTLFDE